MHGYRRGTSPLAVGFLMSGTRPEGQQPHTSQAMKFAALRYCMMRRRRIILECIYRPTPYCFYRASRRTCRSLQGVWQEYYQDALVRRLAWLAVRRTFVLPQYGTVNLKHAWANEPGSCLWPRLANATRCDGATRILPGPQSAGLLFGV